MSGRDWETVSWNKSGQRQKGQTKQQQVNAAMRSGNAAVITEKKYGGGGNRMGGTGMNTKTLDEDNENLKHATVTMELRKLLQQERGKAGMTQKELATACNVKPQIIQDYEAGRGIPNPIMLGKIERALRQKNPEMQMGTLTKAQKGKKPGAKKGKK